MQSDNRKQNRKETQRKWVERSREHLRRYSAAYRIKNRERKRQIGRKWMMENRERYLQQKRRSYIKHRDARLRASADYAKRNPHIAVMTRAKRRLRIYATIENETAIADFIKLIRRSKWIWCYYCRKRVPGRKAHIDHVIPLSKGGGHKPANLCASCPDCNNAKQAKLLSEWKRDGQQILAL